MAVFLFPVGLASSAFDVSKAVQLLSGTGVSAYVAPLLTRNGLRTLTEWKTKILWRARNFAHDSDAAASSRRLLKVSSRVFPSCEYITRDGMSRTKVATKQK